MTQPSDSESPAPAPKAASPKGESTDAAPPPAPAPNAAGELTPEEQMERFERELKETDWGHQPC
jgi:hypothetical protein